MFAEYQTCRDDVPGSSARLLLLHVQRRSQPTQLFMVSLFCLPFKMFVVLCQETPLLLSAIVLPNSTGNSLCIVLFILLRIVCLVLLISSVLYKEPWITPGSNSTPHFCGPQYAVCAKPSLTPVADSLTCPLPRWVLWEGKLDLEPGRKLWHGLVLLIRHNLLTHGEESKYESLSEDV